ncbi:hypothetical protein BpHYR1_049449 [Brachionus plicatilis]|uniref:Uncharacterized protein n=1 Tax=Brachionus plicatilis TaxID=10195 RepID=A0A3M7SB65_BRAPC|nr:hypothetical protein BpHYR1_049449 [Brachionus plicatilis]
MYFISICRADIFMSDEINGNQFSAIFGRPFLDIIGQKRRPGRPKLTANGLERQPGEAVSDSSDEDTYEDYLDIPVNQQTNIQINNTTEIIYENEEEEEINHVE